jgi:hypothetical protein
MSLVVFSLHGVAQLLVLFHDLCFCEHRKQPELCMMQQSSCCAGCFVALQLRGELPFDLFTAMLKASNARTAVPVTRSASWMPRTGVGFGSRNALTSVWGCAGS